MRDPKAIRKAIMTAKSIAAMVDPHFARVPLPEIGEPDPEALMPPREFAAGGVISGRSPELQDYAQNIGTPDFDQETYHSLIDQHKPVRPYESVPEPATEEDMLRGLTTNKHHKINAVDEYQEGHPVGLRLDIPAYTKHGVWVPTMHDLLQGGKAFSHQGAAHITDAVFDMPESQAIAVAKGRAKSPFAHIDGHLKKTPVHEIHEMAKDALDDPQWVQVGMDPERHSYFYDRSDHRKPIRAAEEVIQVGPLVLAKNPVFGDPRDHAFAAGGEVDDDGRDLNKFGLYSHAAEQAGSLARQDTPDNYRDMLLKRGVRPAELEWSGYDKAFANQPMITRDQLVDHFKKNMPDLFETQYNGSPDGERIRAMQERHGQETRENALNRGLAELNGREYEGESPDEMHRRHSEERRSLHSAFHEDYSLPGGLNYREILLQNNAFGGFEGVMGHFGGAPDIIASLRMKDRRDHEGSRVLHLDELQSDWAQQGRKKGFKHSSPKILEDYVRNLSNRFEKPFREHLRDQGESDESIERLLQSYKTDAASMAHFMGESDKLNGLVQDVSNAKHGTINPAAYVTKTDDWVDLGLKRALMEAAKGNYDKLAWSPGDVQADRYDLSKHISRIHHENNDDGTYNLIAYNHDGNRIYNEDDIPEEKLEELLGKEMAQKVVSGEGMGHEEANENLEQAKNAYEEFREKVLDNEINRRLKNRAESHPDKEISPEAIDIMKDIIKEDMQTRFGSYVKDQGLNEEYKSAAKRVTDARNALVDAPYSPYRNWRTMSGLDLKVGGEGMRKFYDEMLPKRLMRLAKQHDPDARFSSSTITHPQEHGDDDYQPDVKTDLPAIQITPRMRESILKNGFAAYAAGGEVEPNPQNPMAGTFESENVPSVTVSPRPGKMGGYPVRAGTMDEQEPWSYTTPQGEDQPMPPPVQHPVFNEPRMDKIHKATHKIFKSKGFNDLTEELTGLRNFTVKPIIGTWKGEIEPSFHISHPNMTPEAAEKLSHLLGFGFMQDAAVKGLHNPNPENEGIPSVYMGHNKKLSKADIDRIHDASREEGLDFSQTSDGRGVKFMHFGDEGDEFDKFAESVKRVADKTGLPHLYHVNTSGDLNYAQDYLKGIFGPHEGEAGELGDLGRPARPSDLFGRVVNHIISPYAKAVASEGYRLSPDRLRDTYGLSDEEHEQVRKALLPGSKDRTVIPLMEGEEALDIRPTGVNGKATVGDALFALQNRAAAHGQIEPGDFSKEAMEKIAQDIAKEVNYHVSTADKSAIGWYDAALKKAMNAYEKVFPELKTDDEKRMLFHAILGITSQGNDVHSNSVHTARLYNLLRDDGMTLPEGVEKLKGTFGDKTRAIEQNLLKFHHLVDANGYDKMRDLFAQKKSVSQWNKILKDNPELYGPDGKPLSMQGGANQKVTGWTVFGPKIGSFINNLSGDYSTLTADLWFSRTWNRLLGHNFIHTPLAEAKQYQDFRDALVAEHAHHNPDQALGEAAEGKTSNGEVTMRNGKPIPWEHGRDVAGMGRDEVDALINDPDKMLEMAKTLSDKYRKGGFKDKSDLRRRAKNWMENRELPVAAPRGNSERDFQQNTVERSQRILKNKYGKNITVADIQAALWFLEKDLFGKMGVASEKAAPADYADAAANTIDLINKGTLYNVKSRPTQAPEIAKAYGGSIKKAMTVLSVPHARKVRSALMIAKGLKKK